jgi:hypothetical protein
MLDIKFTNKLRAGYMEVNKEEREYIYKPAYI